MRCGSIEDSPAITVSFSTKIAVIDSYSSIIGSGNVHDVCSMVLCDPA